MSNRYPCENCDARRGVAKYNESSYCFACGRKEFYKSLIKKTLVLKKERVSFSRLPLTEKQKKWLSQYYINENHIKTYGICSNTNLNGLYFPQIVNRVVKSIWERFIDKSLYKWILHGNKTLVHLSLRLNFKKIILVEDIISAIRVADYADCIALCGTNVQVDGIDEVINSYNEVVLWMDGDMAGRRAAHAIRKKYKLIKPIRIIRTKKDPKCHTPTEIREILND